MRYAADQPARGRAARLSSAPARRSRCRAASTPAGTQTPAAPAAACWPTCPWGRGRRPSPTFDHFVDDAVATGLKRAEVVREMRAAGQWITADALESRQPFGLTRFPVAIAPGRFGDDHLPVMIDAATIGHAAERRPAPDRGLLAGIADALRRGRAKADGNTVRVYDAASRLFVVMERVPGAWRVRTAFPARIRYFDRQLGEEH